MLSNLIRTPSDRVLGLARIAFGLVMFPHGAQHLFGWFGGYGFAGTMNWFASLGIPAPLGAFAILLEFFGSIALIFGLASRPIALGLATIMAVAALRVHLPNGFFMNWLGNQKGEGFEYQILAIALAALLVARGSGAWSIDRLIGRQS